MAAISSPKPSPLLDEVHVCLLRAMYLDDLPEQRASRSKDPMLLDRITWPEFLWDYLHERGSLLVRLQCASVSGCPGESATLGFMEDQDPGEAVGPEPEGPWKRMRLPREEVDATPCRQVEYYSLPAATKAAVLQELCNGVLSSRVVKDELDARVEGKQWVAGRGGEGGAFPMFSEGMKAEKVEAEDGGEHPLQSPYPPCCRFRFQK